MSKVWEVENLGYAFPEQKRDVLRGIGFSVEAGQWTVIFGHNGSGKSTLLKIMAGLYEPGTGAVSFAGKKLSDWKDGGFRPKVAWLGQHAVNQLITTSVEEELAFGLENLALPAEEIRRRVDYFLQEWGLAPYRHHPPHLLSGGQQQKLALASVLIMEPEALLADEPFLYAGAGLELRRKFDALRARGVTIVMATPDPSAMLHADKIIILKSGALIWKGSPEQLFMQKERWPEWGIFPPPLWEFWSYLADLGCGDGIKNLEAEKLVRKYADYLGGRPFSVQR
ncbi:MAG: energy-coupling factor ABC transporter ATP-binding protein [Bacillota bacterium]